MTCQSSVSSSRSIRSRLACYSCRFSLSEPLFSRPFSPCQASVCVRHSLRDQRPWLLLKASFPGSFLLLLFWAGCCSSLWLCLPFCLTALLKEPVAFCWLAGWTGGSFYKNEIVIFLCFTGHIFPVENEFTELGAGERMGGGKPHLC